MNHPIRFLPLYFPNPYFEFISLFSWMDDSTLTPTVLFIFAILQMGPAMSRTSSPLINFEDKSGKTKTQLFSKPDGSSRLLKTPNNNKTSETKRIQFNFTLIVHNQNCPKHIPHTLKKVQVKLP